MESPVLDYTQTLQLNGLSIASHAINPRNKQNFGKSSTSNPLVQSNSVDFFLEQYEHNIIKPEEANNQVKIGSLPQQRLSQAIPMTHNSGILDESNGHKSTHDEIVKDADNSSDDAKLHDDEIAAAVSSLNDVLLNTPITAVEQNLETDKMCNELQEILSSCFDKKLTPNILKTSEVNRVIRAAKTRSPDVLVSTIFEIPGLRSRVEEKLCRSLGQAANNLRSRSSRSRYISQLAKKRNETLETFDWPSIVKEMVKKIPLLLRMMVAVVLVDRSKDKKSIAQRIVAILPKLCTVFSILIHARNPSFDRLQRSVSFFLHDSLSERKVKCHYIRYICLYSCLIVTVYNTA